MKLIIASLFANPLHVGHVRYLTAAKKMGDSLLVIVNTDLQVGLKGSNPFMNQGERLLIVNALKPVDVVTLAYHDKDLTVAKTLESVFGCYKGDEFVFAKGGDRASALDMPQAELDVCAHYNCRIVYGVGGYDKVQSSSQLIARSLLK